MARYEEPVSIAKFQDKEPIQPGGPDAASTGSQELRKILERRHKEYKKYEKSWERTMDCYTGDIEVVRKYIHMHTREHKKDFANRQQRATYVNYCEPVVDLFVSYVYRRPPVRKPLGDLKIPIPLERLLPVQQPQQQPPAGEEEQQQPGQQPGQPGQQPQQQGGFGQQPQQPPKPPTPPGADAQEAVAEEVIEGGPGAKEVQSQLDDLTQAQIAYFIAQGGPQQLAVFNDLYRDADLKGTTFDRFMQNAAVWAQIHGHAGVLIDVPKADQENPPKSEQERKERNLRPYLVVIPAPDIVDWEKDELGKFRWVRIKENTEAPRAAFETEEPKEITRYITWTVESWHAHIIDEKGNAFLEDEGPNPLGYVPFVIIYNKRKKGCSLVGESSIDDIAVINTAILNWMSMLDEEVYQKCLAILVAKRAPGDEEGSKSIELSSHNVLEYPEDAPAFIAPPTQPHEFMLELIKQSVEEIYRIARMGGGGTGVQIKEAKSGVAHAYEFNETNQALADKADQLEQGEIEIHKIYAHWYDMEFKGRVSYSDEFGVEDLREEFDFLARARLAVTSHTALRELEKRVIKKMLATTIDQKTMQKILFEIDTNTKEDYKPQGEFVIPGAAPKPSSTPGEGAQLLPPGEQQVKPRGQGQTQVR